MRNGGRASIKTLQYVKRGRSAQCHLPNKTYGVCCAAQYDGRARGEQYDGRARGDTQRRSGANPTSGRRHAANWNIGGPAEFEM